MSTPPSLNELLHRWQLRSDGQPIQGHNAFVQPVQTMTGAAAMLRIGDPHGDSAKAWLALQCWVGDGAVQVFRVDADRDVLLLERLDARRDLDSLPIEQAITVAAELRARLIRTAPPGLPTVHEVTASWEDRLRSANHAILPGDLAASAAATCHELREDADTQFLVNADLHYRNVLAGVRAPWLVIDPMPVAADREFGVASLIWGRWPESRPKALIRRVAEVGGLDRQRTVAWTVVETAVKLLTASQPVALRCRAVLDELMAQT